MATSNLLILIVLFAAAALRLVGYDRLVDVPGASGHRLADCAASLRPGMSAEEVRRVLGAPSVERATADEWHLREGAESATIKVHYGPGGARRALWLNTQAKAYHELFRDADGAETDRA